MTRIGLGLAALGRPGYINLGHQDDLRGNYDVGPMEAHAHKMLELAYQKGIRYFDHHKNTNVMYNRVKKLIVKTFIADSI